MFYSPTPTTLEAALYDSDQGSDTFFIKNSQNIQRNLAQVLKNNEEDICNVWLRRLLENWPEATLMLKHRHLKNFLLPGFRDFISSSQNILFLSNALNLLAKEFEEIIQSQSSGANGANVANGPVAETVKAAAAATTNGEKTAPNEDKKFQLAKQIQTAIYYFQDAIDSILKIQNIPPHWIFALDSLIRAAVQSALNLLYQNFKHLFKVDDIDSVNTETNLTGTLFNRQNSCMTNFESSISHPSFEEEILFSRQIKEQFKTELKQLIQENQKTVKTLSETFAEYLQEQNTLFRHLCEQVSHAKMDFSSTSQRALLCRGNSTGEPCQSTTADTNTSNSNASTSIGSITDTASPTVDTSFGDPQMLAFLHSNHLCPSTIRTVSVHLPNDDLFSLTHYYLKSQLVKQDITLQVMLEFMTRDDIRKLGLTLGEELRLWNAICKHKSNSPCT